MNLQTNKKYKEIVRLHELLEAACIPHTFKKRFDGHQVCYPVSVPSKRCVASVIEFTGSYGAETDLLELMGLLTEEESKYDSVLGSMSAVEVFVRIYEHYRGVLEK